LKTLTNEKVAGFDIAQRPGRREDCFHSRFSIPSSITYAMRKSSPRIGS